MSNENATGRLRWIIRGADYTIGTAKYSAERVLQQEFRVRRSHSPVAGVIVEEFETVWRDVPEQWA